MFAGLFAQVAAPVMASQLPAIFDDIRPHLVVSDVAELGVAPGATSRGVRRLVVAYSGVLPRPVIDAAAAALGPVWAAFSLPVPADLGLYQHDYVHPLPAMLGQPPSAHGVRKVRPVPAEGSAHDRIYGLDHLAVDRPLAYLTYGTEMGFAAPWRSLLGGLARVDVDVVVTTGSKVDLRPILQDLDEATRSRIHLFDYVPQAALLARASLVVSHGGAGTMIAAGAAGVPQIVVPVGADQFDMPTPSLPRARPSRLRPARLHPRSSPRQSERHSRPTSVAERHANSPTTSPRCHTQTTWSPRRPVNSA